MKLPVSHLATADDLLLERIELSSTSKICQLVKVPVVPFKRPAHFPSGIGPFMSYPVDQEIDALLRRPIPQVIVQREDDACASMHMPKQHPDLILRRLWKFQIP